MPPTNPDDITIIPLEPARIARDLRLQLAETLTRGTSRILDARETRRAIRQAAGHTGACSVCGALIEEHRDDDLDHCAALVRRGAKERR